MHIDPNGDDEEVTEEEIRMMVDAGGERARSTAANRK